MMEKEGKLKNARDSETNSPELVSIIIPVYNSTVSLEEIALRVNSVFDNYDDLSCELIFVDDASPEKKTWPILKELSSKFDNVEAIQFSKNFGQQAATLCGLEMAKGDYAVTMDDDLQHLPEDIPLLLEKKDHDVVIGQFGQKKHSFLTRFTSNIKAWFDYKLIGKPRHIKMSPFRLIKRRVFAAIPFSASPFPFIPALLFALTKDVVGVLVRHEKEMTGRSNYTLYKRFKLFTNLLINNSSLLLKMIGTFGISLSGASLLMASWYVFKKLFLGIGLIGWTSTMVAVLFVGGLLLFSVGVIGEYLIRIIAVVEHKPAYHIKRFKS